MLQCYNPLIHSVKSATYTNYLGVLVIVCVHMWVSECLSVKEKKGLVPCPGQHCIGIGLVLIHDSDNPLTELSSNSQSVI